MDLIWKYLSKKTIDSSADIDKVVSILLKNRNINTDKIKSFLEPISPDKIRMEDLGVDKKELEKSYKRIDKAVKENEQVAVYGDYDADGICAVANVWETLSSLGLKLHPFIPDRTNDGYGLRPESIDKLKQKLPELSLIITVDNGITAHEAIKTAKKQGIDVIVIDHHQKDGKNPASHAVIHSTQVSAGFLSWLWCKKYKKLSLDLAVISTISDVMCLQGPNRSVVKHGLVSINNTKRKGLVNLCKSAGVALDKNIEVYHVGFMIAPRINALGRVADSLDALRLLCFNKDRIAKDLSLLANRINQKRQFMVEEGLTKALIKSNKSKDKLISVYDKSFHKGIIGLIASKLTEKYYRPSLVMSIDGGIVHGSARSVDGVDITKLLRKSKILLEVGGHEKAAGFSLKEKDLENFIKELKKISKVIDKNKLVPVLNLDAKLNLSALSLDFYDKLNELSPYGEGNPEPLFASERLRVLTVQTVGRDSNHLKLLLDDPRTKNIEKVKAEAMGFNMGKLFPKLMPGDEIDVAYSLMENIWQGRRSLTLKIKDLKMRKQVVK
jgi:single-stranded-DNA-specific exonuclease